MHARSDRAYPWAESVILFLAAFAAYELKRQFGLFAHQVFKLGGNAREYFLGMGMNEIVILALLVLALLVYQRTSLPNAPWLERLLYRDKAEKKEIRIWRPALVATLITLGIAAVLAVGGSFFGHSDKLFSTLHSPTIPRATMIKLWSMYPLALFGAPIEEEITFRMGLVTLLVFALQLVLPKANPRGLGRMWIPIILVGIYFGYVHVAENLETIQTGNLALSLLIAPQTWAGIIFGYVFCTWGLESAIVTHFLTDLAAPVVLGAAGLLARAVH